MRKLFLNTLLPIIVIGGLTIYGILIGNNYYGGFSINNVYADSLEDDDSPVETGPDVSGMFNERGYYKSSSLSVDENEVISDFNGNLMYTFPMFNIKGMGDLYADFSLTYNGSMSYQVIAGDSTDVGSTQQTLPQYNFNAPGWVFGLNGMGVQMLNFETNFFTNAPNSSDTLVQDDKVRLLATGYHLTERLNTSDASENFRDKLMILQGDGSVLTLKRFTGPSTGGSERYYIGEYYTENRGEQTRAVVKYLEDGETAYRNREVHVMRGDGLTYVYREHKVEFEDFPLTLTSNPQLRPQILMLEEIRDRFGHKITLTYQYEVNDVIGNPNYEIKGRPWLSNISIEGGGAISLVYGHNTTLGVTNVYGPTGKYRVEMDGFDIFENSPHRPFVEKIVNPVNDNFIFTPEVYTRRGYQLTYVQPGNTSMSVIMDLKRIGETENYNGGVREYSYMGASSEFATMNPTEGYKIMVWGGGSIINTKYFGQGRDVFFNNMVNKKVTRNQEDEIIKQDTFMYKYSTGRTYAEWGGNPVDAGDDYFTVIETTPGSAGFQYESPGKFGTQKKYKNYGVGIVQIGESSADIEGHTKMVRELFYNTDTSSYFKKTDYYFITGESSAFPDTLITETIDGVERSIRNQFQYAAEPSEVPEGLRPVVQTTNLDPFLQRTEVYNRIFVDTSIHYLNGIFKADDTLFYDTTFFYLINMPDSMLTFSPDSNLIHKETSEYILENGILNPGISDSGYMGQLKIHKVFAGPTFTDFKETQYKYFMNDTLGMTLWNDVDDKPSTEGKLRSVIDPNGNYTNYFYHLIRGLPGLNSSETTVPSGPGITYKIAKVNGTIDSTNTFFLRDDRPLPSIVQSIPNENVSLYSFAQYSHSGNKIIEFNNNRFISSYGYEGLNRIDKVILPFDFGTEGLVHDTIIDTTITDVEYVAIGSEWGYKDFDNSELYALSSDPTSYRLSIHQHGEEESTPYKQLPVLKLENRFIDSLSSMDTIESVTLVYHPLFLTRDINGNDTTNNFTFNFIPATSISIGGGTLNVTIGSSSQIAITTHHTDTTDCSNISTSYANGEYVDSVDVTTAVKTFLGSNDELQGFLFETVPNQLPSDYTFYSNFAECIGSNPGITAGNWIQLYSPRLIVKGRHRKIDTTVVSSYSGYTLDYLYFDSQDSVQIFRKLDTNRSKVSEYLFDGFYRVKKGKLYTSNTNYDSTQMFYNFMDVSAKTIDGRGNETQLSYDKFINVKKTLNEDTSYTLDTSTYQNGLSYYFGTVSGMVNKMVFTDEVGNNFEKFTDAVGNLRREVKFGLSTTDSMITDYRYDSLYRVTDVKTPEGRLISYVYDGFNRQVERTTVDAGTERFKHDKNDNLRFSNDASQADTNDFTFRTYDGTNRLLSIGHPNYALVDRAWELLDPDTAYFFESYTSQTDSNFLAINVYDTLSSSIAGGLFTAPDDFDSLENLATGKLIATAFRTRTTDPWNFKYYRYDARGRVIRMWQVITGLGTKVFDYEYNSSNQPTLISYQIDDTTDEIQYNYVYDDAGRLKDVECSDRNRDTLFNFVSCTYNQNSQISSKSFHDSAFVMQNAYNNRNWLDSTGDGTIFLQQLNYLTNGNVANQILSGNYKDNMNNTEELNSDFEYDRSNRLLSIDYPLLHGALNMNMSYDKDGNLDTLLRYDVNGNLADEFIYSYYTGTNKVQDVGSHTEFTYDANGNVLSQELDGVYIGNMKYDYRNLLVEYEYPFSGGGISTAIARIWYDEAGNRIRQVAVVNNGGASPTPNWDSLEYFPQYLTGGSNSWERVFDKWYVRNVGGNEVARYNFANLKGWNIEGEGTIDAQSNKLFYIKDHLGTTRAIIDTTSTVVQAQDVDAWGYGIGDREYIGSSNDDYIFTGKERDGVSTGFDYFGARYYNSRIGRWNSVDAYTYKNCQYSPYVYSSNNPIVRIDVNGLDDYYYTDGNTYEVVKTDPNDPDKESGSKDRYFVQNKEGNYIHNGKNFFRANSNATVTLYPNWNKVDNTGAKIRLAFDYAIPKDEFMKKVYRLFELARINYAKDESTDGGKMDPKEHILRDETTLYIFDNIAYNKNEAGNIVWGAAMAYLGFDEEETLKWAQVSTLYRMGRPDEEEEQVAISRGWGKYNSEWNKYWP